MTFLTPLLLVGGGVALIASGFFVMRPEPRAPKDWRYWSGTVIALVGAATFVVGILLLTDLR